MTPFSPAPLEAPFTRHVVLGALLSLLTAGAAPAAENLVENPGFDTDTSGWELTEDSAPATLSWAPDDAAGDPGSGSLEIAGGPTDEDVVVLQCIGPPVPGSKIEAGGMARFVEGGVPDHNLTLGVSVYSQADCGGFLMHGATVDTVSSRLAWSSMARELDAHEDGESVALVAYVRPRNDDAGPFVAQLDDLFFRVEGSGGGGEEDPPEPDPPEPDPDGWFTDPTYPDFRFNVEISAGQTSRLGVWESSCLDETVCVSGAVPGRVEILLRIVGPKGNGRLWPTLFKASTSRFDVWIEQLSTGTMKHYVLEGASPGSSELPGFFDRDGFVP